VVLLFLGPHHLPLRCARSASNVRLSDDMTEPRPCLQAPPLEVSPNKAFFVQAWTHRLQFATHLPFPLPLPSPARFLKKNGGGDNGNSRSYVGTALSRRLGERDDLLFTNKSVFHYGSGPTSVPRLEIRRHAREGHRGSHPCFVVAQACWKKASDATRVS